MKLNELFEAGPYNIDWNRVARESLPLFMLAEDLKDGKVEDGIHRVFVLWLMGYKGDVPTKEVVL